MLRDVSRPSLSPAACGFDPAAEVVERLSSAICPFSAVDLDEHLLAVVRMVGPRTIAELGVEVSDDPDERLEEVEL